VAQGRRRRLVNLGHGFTVLAAAWVLWDTTASMVGTELKPTWQVEAVYPTREPCERAVNAYVVMWKQQGLEVTAEGVAVARRRLGEAEALLLRSHQCLPDTVDPRARGTP
jgi:hypothetical protein